MTEQVTTEQVMTYGEWFTQQWENYSKKISESGKRPGWFNDIDVTFESYCRMKWSKLGGEHQQFHNDQDYRSWLRDESTNPAFGQFVEAERAKHQEQVRYSSEEINAYFTTGEQGDEEQGDEDNYYEELEEQQRQEEEWYQAQLKEEQYAEYNYYGYEEEYEPYSDEYPISQYDLARLPADMRSVFDPSYQEGLANFRAGGW